MNSSEIPQVIDPSNQGIFANLLAACPIPDGRNGRLLATSKSLYKVNGRDVYVGRDVDGYPHLLLPKANGETMEISNVSALMSAGPRTLQQPGGLEEDFVDLVCTSGEADGLFAAIAYDICRSIDGRSDFDGVSLLSAITQTILHWRAILDAIGDAQSSSAKTGLLGELLALAAFAEVKGEEALNGWTGPSKTRHDFEFKNTAFEIKTSLSLNSKSCVIHGINQLNAATGTDLFLAHFQIEFAAEGISVNSLLQELAEAGISQTKMQEKLSDIWPLGAPKPKWFEVLRFKISSCSLFSVNEDFPRITVSNIGAEFAPYINNVQYRVNLDGLKPFKSTVSEPSWRKVLTIA